VIEMDALEEVLVLIKKLDKGLDKAGIIGKARKRFLLGEDIKKCPFCHTYNCYSEYYSSKHNWQGFKCSNCGKRHTVGF